MSPTRRSALVVMTVVQLSLATAAWADLARRPAARIRGRKWIWGLVIGINFVGPLSYFRWGRLGAKEIVEGNP